MLGQVNLACKKSVLSLNFCTESSSINFTRLNTSHCHWQTACMTTLLSQHISYFSHGVNTTISLVRLSWAKMETYTPLLSQRGHIFFTHRLQIEMFVCKCCNNIPAVSTFWLFLILVSIQLMQFIQPHWWSSFIPVENDPGCITLLFYENKWSCLSDKEMERESPIFQANFCSFFGALL